MAYKSVRLKKHQGQKCIHAKNLSGNVFSADEDNICTEFRWCLFCKDSMAVTCATNSAFRSQKVWLELGLEERVRIQWCYWQCRYMSTNLDFQFRSRSWRSIFLRANLQVASFHYSWPAGPAEAPKQGFNRYHHINLIWIRLWCLLQPS